MYYNPTRIYLITLMIVFLIILFSVIIFTRSDSMNNINDYITIIIEGMFGISTIIIGVFSIVSSNIQRKYVGLKIADLNRYRTVLLFLPIYVLTLSLLAIFIFPSYCNNLWFVFSSFAVLVIVSIIQSTFILKPLYNLEIVKQLLIKKKLKELTKTLKKQKGKNYIELEKIILTDFEDMVQLLLVDASEDINSTLENKKEVYLKYLEIRSQVNKESYSENLVSKFVFFGYKLLGEEFYKIIDDIDLSISDITKYLINGINTQTDVEICNYIFSSLHTIFEDWNGKNTFKTTAQSFNKSFINYIRIILKNPVYFSLILNIIWNDKWTTKDCSYFELYVRNIINICNTDKIYEKNIKSSLSDEDIEKLEYVVESYKNQKKLGKKGTEQFNDKLKTIYILMEKSVKSNVK